jgi:hypothetical protein
MLDAKQLKARGIRFGRAFQMALRTSVMFSPDHPSLVRPLEQSFELLNEVLKQSGQFTIGFVDNQVLINSVLTTEPGLAHLQKEFLKRGIAAVTFEAGLTLARYKHIVTALSSPATAIEQAGGIREYLEAHEIPGARIVAASRNQKMNGDGDTVIESDSEAFILAKQMAEEGPRDFMESLDALLESACLDPASRTAALAGLNHKDPNFAGRGYGVPIAMPNLVVDKSSEPGTGWNENSAGGSNEPGNGGGTGGGGGFGGGDGSFVGLSAGPGTGFGGGAQNNPEIPDGGSYVVTQATGQGIGNRQAGSEGGYRTFMELVDDSVSRSLVEDKGNPRKSYLALARILKESRMDTVLTHFPEERREELRTLPAEHLAAEYVEESTLKLIAKQLSQINDQGQNRYAVEESVLRLLARSLQATHMADRLAFKLAKFFQEFSTPPHLQQKVQDELRWTSLSHKQKYTRLMEKKRYDFTEFRRLMELVKDLIQQREPERMTRLALHYFDFLDEDGGSIEADELSRSIELIRTVKLGREPEAATIIQRLGGVLMREDLPELVHFQAANNLAILSQSAAVFEAFEKVLIVAEALRQSITRDPEKHKKCCATGSRRMLSATSIERLIELYLANRTDANYTRLAATILRYSHPVGTDAALKHLIEEKNAANRLALLRLISMIGPLCLEHARKYLQDDRWYVVRNMCNLLAELRDPELANHLAEVLKHREERVQQAALNALTKSRAPGRAELIALALGGMAPAVQDQSLDELLFLRSPGCVAALDAFVSSGKTTPVMIRKALQAMGNIPGEEATSVLNRLAASLETSDAIRKYASELLQRRPAADPNLPAAAIRPSTT